MHDEQWVARFGRLRALHYLERMRALAPDGDGEVHSTGPRRPTAGPRGSVATTRAVAFADHQEGGNDDDDDDDDDEDGSHSSDGSDLSGHGPDAVNEEGEHADMLQYAHRHPPDWALTLDTYTSVHSTRPRSAVMHLSGGTYFQEKARKRAEELEREGEANGALAASGEGFRDFFEFGTPFEDEEEEGAGEEPQDSGEDSDPEVTPVRAPI